MKFEKMGGGLALKSKKKGILGWVLATINDQYTFEVSGIRTKIKREALNTEEDAKAGLLEELGLGDSDVQS